MHALNNKGIEWGERRSVNKLCFDRSVKVRLDKGDTRIVKTGMGVRLGCCLWAILLKLHIQRVPSKGSSWRVWRLQNWRASNLHCEICRQSCATS